MLPAWGPPDPDPGRRRAKAACTLPRCAGREAWQLRSEHYVSKAGTDDHVCEGVVQPPHVIVNLAAMFTNAVSSLVFEQPDNPLSRLGDRIDRAIEKRRRLAAFGQMGIIVIEKPR